MNTVLLYVVNDPVYFLSHRLPIALEAKRKGYDVRVASKKSEISSVIENYGIHYYNLPISRGGMNPFRELCAVFFLWGLFLRVRPAVVHAVTIKPVVYSGIASRFFPNIKLVSAVAGLGSIFISDKLKFSLLRKIVIPFLRLALRRRKSVIIFQNLDDRDFFVRIGAIDKKQAVLIPGSGVDLECFKPSPQGGDGMVVTFAARLIRDKGIDEFISAASLLRNR